MSLSCTYRKENTFIPPDLDFTSELFNPEKALACDLILPFPKAKTYNNLAEYYSHTFLKKSEGISEPKKSKPLERNYEWYYSTLDSRNKSSRNFVVPTSNKQRYKTKRSAKKPASIAIIPSSPMRSKRVIQCKSDFHLYCKRKYLYKANSSGLDFKQSNKQYTEVASCIPIEVESNRLCANQPTQVDRNSTQENSFEFSRDPLTFLKTLVLRVSQPKNHTCKYEKMCKVPICSSRHSENMHDISEEDDDENYSRLVNKLKHISEQIENKGSTHNYPRAVRNRNCVFQSVRHRNVTRHWYSHRYKVNSYKRKFQTRENYLSSNKKSAVSENWFTVRMKNRFKIKRFAAVKTVLAKQIQFPDFQTVSTKVKQPMQVKTSPIKIIRKSSIKTSPVKTQSLPVKIPQSQPIETSPMKVTQSLPVKVQRSPPIKILPAKLTQSSSKNVHSKTIEHVLESKILKEKKSYNHGCVCSTNISRELSSQCTCGFYGSAMNKIRSFKIPRKNVKLNK